MSLIPQQIRERIYKGWHFIVTITTPMVCVYALYDIKEILFSTKRKERYSKQFPENSQSKPVDTVPGNKSTKKETPTSDEKNPPKQKEKRTFKKKKKTKKGITMSTVKTIVDLFSDMVKGMFAKPTDSKTSFTISTEKENIDKTVTEIADTHSKDTAGSPGVSIEKIDTPTETENIDKTVTEKENIEKTVTVNLQMSCQKKTPVKIKSKVKRLAEMADKQNKETEIADTHSKYTAGSPGVSIEKIGTPTETENIDKTVTEIADTHSKDTVNVQMCCSEEKTENIDKTVTETENIAKTVTELEDIDNIFTDRDDIDNIITARPLKGSTEMDNIETMLYRRIDRDDIENFATVYWQMFWREEGIPVYALEGGHIKLGKAVHISTKAKWTKNNKPIQSKHIELDLYNLSIADEGFYVCEFGPNNLQLKYLLFVLETEETVCTEKNHIVYLGIPKQDVDSLEWTKDGKVIESTYHSQTWLTVPIKSLDDTGLYVCTFGPNHMQLKYRLVVVDQIEEIPRHQMTLLGCFGRKVRHTWLEEFANTQRNVKKITIRCEGRFEEEKGMEITLGPKGLMLQCHIFLPKPIEQVTMFRYENEKYKEDEYMHYYTQVGYIWKPEQSYIIVRLLKTLRNSGS